MRGKLAVVALVGFAVLTTAGTALAANGGFTPPEPNSPNAERINQAYYLIAVFTIAIFLVVISALVYFIWRYRSRGRPRTVDGTQLHGNTRIEIIWTAIPIVIICIIFGFVFYKLPGISDPPKASAADTVLIRVDAHQFYWQFTYPNGAISIDTLHLPVHRVTKLTVNSEDVNHSWWIPELGGKIDAIAGRTNTIWYKPDRTGTFRGQCAEFCGLFHERMLAHAVVEDDADYQRFIDSTAAKDLGRAQWEGVCAKCHGLQGQGDYGPPIAANPTLVQPAALESLLRDGRGLMPAVGNNWTDEQFRALERYMKAKVYTGGS